MAYLVVNHVSDELKQEGFVESYQMVNVEIQNEDGTTAILPKRLNFVHWPQLPIPFLHEEWSENLAFANVYVPENDDNDSEDEDDDDALINEEIVELLENDYPQVFEAILSEIEASDADEDDTDSDEIDEDENQTLA